MGLGLERSVASCTLGESEVANPSPSPNPYCHLANAMSLALALALALTLTLGESEVARAPMRSTSAPSSAIRTSP